MASDTSTQGTLATAGPPALVSETAYTRFGACMPKALVMIPMVRPALAKIETRATDMKKTASRLYLRSSGCSSLPVAFATPSSSSSLTSTLGGALLLLSFSGFISVICRSKHRHAPGEHLRPCRHFVAEAAGGWGCVEEWSAACVEECGECAASRVRRSSSALCAAEVSGSGAAAQWVSHLVWVGVEPSVSEPFSVRDRATGSASSLPIWCLRRLPVRDGNCPPQGHNRLKDVTAS
eukprot:scaffold25521_cov63-Phaeocystis_antarctica.AAC.1